MPNQWRRTQLDIKRRAAEDHRRWQARQDPDKHDSAHFPGRHGWDWPVEDERIEAARWRLTVLSARAISPDDEAAAKQEYAETLARILAA